MVPSPPPAYYARAIHMQGGYEILGCTVLIFTGKHFPMHERSPTSRQQDTLKWSSLVTKNVLISKENTTPHSVSQLALRLSFSKVAMPKALQTNGWLASAMCRVCRVPGAPCQVFSHQCVSLQVQWHVLHLLLVELGVQNS